MLPRELGCGIAPRGSRAARWRISTLVRNSRLNNNRTSGGCHVQPCRLLARIHTSTSSRSRMPALFRPFLQPESRCVAHGREGALVSAEEEGTAFSCTAMAIEKWHTTTLITAHCALSISSPPARTCGGVADQERQAFIGESGSPTQQGGQPVLHTPSPYCRPLCGYYGQSGAT